MTTQSLYDEYKVLSKTYQEAIKNYKEELLETSKQYVSVHCNSNTYNYYIGSNSNMNLNEMIKYVKIYYNLKVSLYPLINFVGTPLIYYGNVVDGYDKVVINQAIQSIKVERVFTTDNNYDVYSGKKFLSVGGGKVVNNLVTTIQDCANTCINTVDCTASLFNSSLNTCTIYNKPGILGNSNDNDNVIIPSNKRQMLILYELYKRLKELYTEISLQLQKDLDKNKELYAEKVITYKEYEVVKNELTSTMPCYEGKSN